MPRGKAAGSWFKLLLCWQERPVVVTVMVTVMVTASACGAFRPRAALWGTSLG